MATPDAKNLESPRPWVAVLVATILLIGGGLGYRAAAGRLADVFAIPPLPRGVLAKLSLEIGGWTGRDSEALNERIFEELRADEYVGRTYTRMGNEAVALFIALRRNDIGYGLSTQHLMPHEPAICYPAHGWMPDGTRTVQLQAVDGSPLPAEIFRFHRGELEVERIVILAYYIRNRQRYADPSRLRSRGWRLAGNVQYVVQVQIACPDDRPGCSAEELVRAFAEDSAPHMLELVSNAVEDARAQAKNSTD